SRQSNPGAEYAHATLLMQFSIFPRLPLYCRLTPAVSRPLLAVHGNIDMQTLATSITCESQHGEVILSAINPDLEKVKVKSSFNDIHVTLANGLNPAISTSASFGEVESEFSGNSGGPEVKLHVEHGDITIRRQKNAEQE
ncbi:MAG: hypothetical protein ABGZ53_11770, partial [Fuerstiella sp.]